MGPSASPDGKTILCASGPELWVIDIDGKNPHKIAKLAGMMVAYPRWSPDGKKIVYGMVSGLPPNHKTDIFIINTDGSGEKALTNGDGISEYPCWSPDGKSIAFQTSRDGNYEIYVISFDGGNIHRLTDNPAMDGRPSWGSVNSRRSTMR
jgi:TolB protein